MLQPALQAQRLQEQQRQGFRQLALPRPLEPRPGAGLPRPGWPLRALRGGAHHLRCDGPLRTQSVPGPRRRGHPPAPGPGDGLRPLRPKGPAAHAAAGQGGSMPGAVMVHWQMEPADAERSEHWAWEPGAYASRRPRWIAKDHATCQDARPGLGRPSMSESSSLQCRRCACRRYQPCISRLSSVASGKRSPSTAGRSVSFSVGLAR